MDLCLRYPNVYTDTSFMLGNAAAVNQLKYWLVREPKLIDKVLFGSDFYMTDLLDCDLPRLIYDLRAILNHERFAQITTVNPARFLRLPA